MLFEGTALCAEDPRVRAAAVETQKTGEVEGSTVVVDIVDCHDVERMMVSYLVNIEEADINPLLPHIIYVRYLILFRRTHLVLDGITVGETPKSGIKIDHYIVPQENSGDLYHCLLLLFGRIMSAL
jgi:hypothetical protein